MHTPSLYSQENLISAAHNVHPWRWSRVYVRQSGLLLSTLMSTCWRSRSDQRRRVTSRFVHFMLMCCIYSLALQASSWSSQEWLVSGHSKFNITHSSKHTLGTHEAWNNTPNTASSTPPSWPHHALCKSATLIYLCPSHYNSSSVNPTFTLYQATPITPPSSAPTSDPSFSLCYLQLGSLSAYADVRSGCRVM